MTAFSNYCGSWTRAYDADDRLTSESFAGIGVDISYAYDAAGKKGLKSSMTDVDGRVTTYAYTARNELSSVSEAAQTTSYDYDPCGNQSHTYHGNGVRGDSYYDADGAMNSYYNVTSSGSILGSLAYSHDVDGRISEIREGNASPASNNTTVTDYAYDGLGRMTGETRTGGYAFSGSTAVPSSGGMNASG